jgi:HD-like signal output (HDOD) protein/CheY-like chemotaxis protein
MIRVLFVDDESNVLDGLRRTMHSMRKEWDMRFATSGADALSQLAQASADIVVSDMRMPGMNGAQLLATVKELYPETVRFILSGHAEPTAVMQVACTAHQYLAKPCDRAILKSAITRTRALRALLRDERIARWVGAVDSLPSPPETYRQLTACAQGSDASIAEAVRIVKGDLAISALLLKIANSAFFGAGQAVRTTDRAVSLLGLERLAALVLAQGVFSQASQPAVGLNVAQLWQHSLETASAVRLLALHEKLPISSVDDAFLAAMLHDLGLLVLATNPAAAMAAEARGERADHAEVGAYLVGLWGFPDAIVGAIGFHHRPSAVQTDTIELPGLVHAADLLVHGDGSAGAAVETSERDRIYCECPAVLERWPHWQALVQGAHEHRTGS